MPICYSKNSVIVVPHSNKERLNGTKFFRSSVMLSKHR